MKGRDEKSSATGPQQETLLERHQGPFVKRLNLNRAAGVHCTQLVYVDAHAYRKPLTYRGT